MNQAFSLDVGGRSYPAVLISTVSGDQEGYEALVLTDIAQAQEWLGWIGKLSRIDVRADDAAAAEFRAHCRRASGSKRLPVVPSRAST